MSLRRRRVHGLTARVFTVLAQRGGRGLEQGASEGIFLVVWIT